MYNKFLKRFKSFKPLRRLIIISGIIACYFIFIGLISEFVDQGVIEREIKSWFEESLEYSTFIDIDHTDTALRSDWRTDLYIHEFEIASPQPEFILPLISIDTIRASSNFYSLFGGVSAEPVVQIRDGILNIQKNSEGIFNIQNLDSAHELQKPFFLPNINISVIDFLLMYCKVAIDFPQSKAFIPINGKLRVTDNSITLKSISQGCTFTFSNDGLTKKRKSNIYIKNLVITRKTHKIMGCDISLEDIPASIITLLEPSLPKLPASMNLSGRLQKINNALVFSGVLENLSLPSLPRHLDITMSTNRSIVNNLDYYFLEILSNNKQLLTLKAQKSANDDWEPLQLYFATVDIDQLLSGADSNWLEYLSHTFPAINVVASSATLAGFDIGEAIINVLKDESGITNISLGGSVASGDLTLLAKDISLTSSVLPKMLMATLEIKDTAGTLLKFSKNLPRILDCTPTRGNGEIALLYQRDDEDSTNNNFKIQISLKDVVIPTLSSGEALRVLASFPVELNRLNRLCLNPNSPALDDAGELIRDFDEITLDSLTVHYETSDNDDIQLSSIEANSREIGDIHGKILKLADKSLQLHLSIDNIPTPTLERAKLGTEATKALNNFKREKSFNISLIENNNKVTTQLLYIEEIYREWLNTQ